MDYRPLGRSGIEASVIGLGTWAFGDPGYWGAQDEAGSIETIAAALDAGVTFIDTAEEYGGGRSEEVLGRALAGRRHEAVVATKVSQGHLRPDDVIAACDRSIARLQTDYIDLYQIHYPNHDVPLADTIGAMVRLKEQGKVRAIGVSNFGVLDLTEALESTDIASDQLAYSLLWRGIEHEIQPFVVERGVGIIAFSSLAQGLLSGRYRSAAEVPEGRKISRWYGGPRPWDPTTVEPGAEREVFASLEDLRSLAAEAGLTMPGLAIAWLAAQPGLNSVLVGARDAASLRANLTAIEARLAPKMLARVTAATEPVKAALGENPDMWITPSRIR